jgi:hypothetical protein
MTRRKQVIKPRKDDFLITSDEENVSSNSVNPKTPVPVNSRTNHQSASTETQDKSAKPIYINLGLQEVRQFTSSLKVKATFKVQSAKSTQIIPRSLEDKVAIIAGLKSASIDHYTFSEKSEKTATFVLKGFYDAPCNEVLKRVIEAGITATKVTILARKMDYSFYLVQISSQNINRNVLNHNHRIIDSVFVKWENIRKSTKGPTQCYNCQRWGHSSQNCGFKFRCVKCTENHPVGHCKRTTRDGSPKCVNCNGDHAASHRQYQAFITYSNKIKKQNQLKPVSLVHQHPAKAVISSSSTKHTKQHHQSHICLDTASFPPLIQHQDSNQSSTSTQHQCNKSIDYAEKLNEAIANENLFQRLITIQEKLKQKPKIIEIFNKFCTLMEEADKKSSLGEVVQLLIEFRTSFNTKDPTS